MNFTSLIKKIYKILIKRNNEETSTPNILTKSTSSFHLKQGKVSTVLINRLKKNDGTFHHRSKPLVTSRRNTGKLWIDHDNGRKLNKLSFKDLKIREPLK